MQSTIIMKIYCVHKPTLKIEHYQNLWSHLWIPEDSLHHPCSLEITSFLKFVSFIHSIFYMYLCMYIGEGNGNPLQYSCSGSWWWTGRPGVLQFMGSQRVEHDWATELNWTVNDLFSIKKWHTGENKWATITHISMYESIKVKLVKVSNNGEKTVWLNLRKIHTVQNYVLLMNTHTHTMVVV